MSCYDKQTQDSLYWVYHNIWKKKDDGVPAIENLRGHLEDGDGTNFPITLLGDDGKPIPPKSTPKFELISDANSSTGYREYTAYPVQQWYRSTVVMKRFSKVLLNTIPDILEDVFNSVKPDSEYPLNDVANKLAKLYKSGKIDNKKIIDAFYQDYVDSFETMAWPDGTEVVDRDVFERRFSTNDYDDDLATHKYKANEIQSVATFLYLLRSSKLDKDTALYSGYKFLDTANIPKVGDVFETKSPLCTTVSPKVSFRFHRGSNNLYYNVFHPQVEDEEKSDAVKSWMKYADHTRNTYYILVFKMKSGDGAFKSSNVRDLTTASGIIDSELEYTLPPSKFKVSKIDTEHMWIELEPVR